MASKILDSFDSLKKLLSERALCSDSEIVIYDEPMRIVIKRDRIEFYVFDELKGFITKNTVNISDDIIEEARMWLEGLSFLKFRRFTIKR